MAWGFRRILRWGAAGLGAAGLVLALLVLREEVRDPMPLLDLPSGPLVLREAEARIAFTAAGERRRMIDLTFEVVPEGPLRATLSLPEGRGGPWPVLVILGGLEVGRDSLRYVEFHGPNALVAYAYPQPTRDLYEGHPLLRAGRIRRAALAVPSQVCALVDWIRRQAWADPARVSLLGYSFGAMFVPSSARLAQARNLSLHALVMAYGGADLPRLLAANADLRPAWLRPLAARVVGALLHPLEPALHLPHLRGEALFITGLRDIRVPLPLARRMQSLKPEPKSILDLDEGHMHPSRPEVNRCIVAASQAWLAEKGAMEWGGGR